MAALPEREQVEVEVPEVSERIIEIKAMSREPGHRTKIADHRSNDSNRAVIVVHNTSLASGGDAAVE